MKTGVWRVSELVLKPGDIVQGLYSFSGGVERGATLDEIKRHATIPDILRKGQKCFRNVR